MKEPTLDEIVAARNKCADIIAKYGEQYLPLFERLEREIEMREKRIVLMNRALQISAKNATQNDTQIATQNSKIRYGKK